MGNRYVTVKHGSNGCDRKSQHQAVLSGYPKINRARSCFTHHPTCCRQGTPVYRRRRLSFYARPFKRGCSKIFTSSVCVLFDAESRPFATQPNQRKSVRRHARLVFKICQKVQSKVRKKRPSFWRPLPPGGLL